MPGALAILISDTGGVEVGPPSMCTTVALAAVAPSSFARPQTLARCEADASISSPTRAREKPTMR